MKKDLFQKFMTQAVQKGFAYNLTSENLKDTKKSFQFNESTSENKKTKINL